MKHSFLHSTKPKVVAVICAAGIFTVASMNLQAKDLQVGRYSLFAATPTQAQAELLATTMTVRFPNRIQGVGEAVRYLLQRSGYRLASIKAIGPDTAALFALPLPAVHRSLGPMMLRDALETLTGPAFHLVQDPVHRLVTFERCMGQQITARDIGPNIEWEVVQDGD
jgi:conjugative transfer region protein (TIGR03748 family)